MDGNGWSDELHKDDSDISQACNICIKKAYSNK